MKAQMMLFLILVGLGATFGASLNTRSSGPNRRDEPFQCYNSLLVKTGGMTLVDQKSEQNCTMPQASCSMMKVTMNIAIPGGAGGNAEVGFGGCHPIQACSSFSCENVERTVADLANIPYDFTIDSCESQCCHNSLCNLIGEAPEDNSLTDSQENTITNDDDDGDDDDEPDDGPECHVGVKYSGDIEEDLRNLVKCDAGSSCSKISTYMSKTDSGNHHHVEVSLGQCKSTAACERQNCEDLRQHIRSNYSDQFDGCSVECCEAGGMCMASSVASSPSRESIFEIDSTNSNHASSQDTDTSEDDFECYDGTLVKVNNRIMQHSQSVKTCSSGSSCAYIRAVVESTRGTSHMSMSKCIPTQQCSSFTCAQLLAKHPLPSTDTLKSCTDGCCREDRCNPLTTSQSSDGSD